MADLGTAYVQIVPSAQGIEGAITNLFSGEAQSAGMASGQSMGDSLLGGMGSVLAAGADFVVNHVADIARAAWQTINDVAEYGDTVDKQSQMLSISTTAYQELNYAAQRSGATINTFSRGIRTMTNDLADAQNGVAGATDSWDALGVSITRADGTYKNIEEVMFDTLFALGDMEDITQRNAIANDIFGRSYVELIPLLNSGGDGIRELMQESERLGGVMSEDGVTASADFEDAMLNLQTAIQGVKNNIAESGLLGVFTDFINTAANWVAGDHPILVKAFRLLDTEVQNNERHMSAMSYALDGVESALSPRVEAIRQMFSTLADRIVEELRSISPEMGIVGEALGANFSNMFLHPFRTTVDNIIAMIAGLNGDYQVAGQIMGVNFNNAGGAPKRTSSTVISRKATFQ